jgi:ABC-2 type transport system permease protein
LTFYKIYDEITKRFSVLSQTPSFFQGLKAIFIRNFKILWQYKFNIILNFVNTLIVSTLFYYIALLIPEMQIEQNLYTVDSVSFIFAGFILVDISTKILKKSLNSISSEMKQGTFETLSTLPFGLRKYFISEVAFEMIYGFITSVIFFIPIFLIFPVFRNVSISFASFFSLFLVVFSVGFFFFSLSLLAANFTILIKRGREISLVILGILHLLSGSMFPLSVFPEWLKIIAYFSPFTLGVQAFRLCIFGNGIITDSIVWGAILFLILSSIIISMVFLFTYKKIYKRIRETGSIHEY